MQLDFEQWIQIGRSQISWVFISIVCGGFPCKKICTSLSIVLYLIFYLNCLEQIKLIIPNILQGFPKKYISIYSYIYYLIGLFDWLGLLLRLLWWLSQCLWLLLLYLIIIIHNISRDIIIWILRIILSLSLNNCRVSLQVKNLIFEYLKILGIIHLIIWDILGIHCSKKNFVII